MTPKISVLMPVRDGARWLGEAIASLQNQTLADFELVIVDDGSEDESPQIIKVWSRADSRIRPIRQERLGLIPALNRGLAESRASLIARLDADDLAHPMRLQLQNLYLERNPEIGLLGTWANTIDEQGLVTGSLKPPIQPEILSAMLMRTNPFLHSSIMFRKSGLQIAGLYRPPFQGAEDYDLWLRLSEVTKIANLPEPLLQYRVHSASVTHRARVRQLFSTRLAQRAAIARRTNSYDPTLELISPPNWQAAESENSLIYGDLTGLFRFLDLADPSNTAGANCDHLDLSALGDRNITLSHTERRMAQLALLNILTRGMTTPKKNAAILLWHFIRLHPLRAIQLGYGALLRN